MFVCCEKARLVETVVKDVVIAARGLRFDSRACQIKNCVANPAMFLRTYELSCPLIRKWIPSLVTRFEPIPQDKTVFTLSQFIIKYERQKITEYNEDLNCFIVVD